MRFSPVKYALLVGMVMLINGCGVVTCKICAARHHTTDGMPAQYVANSSSEEQVDEADPLIISVTGFGALDTRNSNKPQQILMAMRASEVDAYRSLAERVKGLQISGNTKVMDFVTDYDHLRALVDSYIKNAKVISQGLSGEGIYETTLSLTLDRQFFRSLHSQSREIRVRGVTESGMNHKAASGFAVPPSSTLSTTDSHYDIGFSPVVR